MAIDFYRAMTNITLNGLGPLDFRFYPMPDATGSKELKLTTSATSYGSICF